MVRVNVSTNALVVAQPQQCAVSVMVGKMDSRE